MIKLSPLQKALLAFAIQIIVILLPWHMNIVIGSHYISALRSMPALCNEAKTNPGIFIDFVKSYACAQIAKDSPNKIWNLATQTKTIEADLGLNQTDPAAAVLAENWAQYTPQSVVMMMPLTLLPLNQAIILFEIISLVLLITSVTMLIQRYLHFSWWQLKLWWLVVLATLPFLQNFCLGQSACIIVALAAIFFLTWEKKNVLLPAFCLALTVAIKPQQSFVMLIMCLAARKFRLLLTAALISILFLSICALVIGIEPILKYPAQLMAIQSAIYQKQLHIPLEWTTAYTLGLSEFISFVLGHPIGHELNAVATLVDLIVIYFVWRKALNIGAAAYPWAYAISVLVDLLLGPNVHIYNLLALITVWASTIPVVQLSRFAELKTHSSRLWFMAFSFFPLVSWYISVYFLKVSGPMHMILLMVLLLIAIANFRTRQILAKK